MKQKVRFFFCVNLPVKPGKLRAGTFSQKIEILEITGGKPGKKRGKSTEM
jgi:hypothetical protein